MESCCSSHAAALSAESNRRGRVQSPVRRSWRPAVHKVDEGFEGKKLSPTSTVHFAPWPYELSHLTSSALGQVVFAASGRIAGHRQRQTCNHEPPSSRLCCLSPFHQEPAAISIIDAFVTLPLELLSHQRIHSLSSTTETSSATSSRHAQERHALLKARATPLARLPIKRARVEE